MTDTTRHVTDPVAEYPPRLPLITRVPVIIEGDRYTEVHPVTGDVLGEGRVIRVREPIDERKAANV